MLIFALTLACVPDDVDLTGDSADTGDTLDTHDTATDTDTAAASLVGDWVSTGADLSPLFAGDPFNYVSIQASFSADGSYTVVGQDEAGATYDFSGTFTVDESTDPGAIVQRQTVPYAATTEGIFAVTGEELVYEVVQTDPDYGYTPPTPTTGFGSTAGPGLTEGLNVQTYQRMD